MTQHDPAEDAAQQGDSPQGDPVRPGQPESASTDTGDTHETGADDDADDQDDTDDGDQDDTDTEQHSANREAARWRTKFRQAQRERDALRQQIVDQIARAEGLSDPGLLAYEGHQMGTLLDDAGAIDATRVRQACAEVMSKHRIAATPKRPIPNLQQGSGSGGHRPSPNAWQKAFAPTRG